MEKVTIVDKNGYIVSVLEYRQKGKFINYELQQNNFVVNYISNLQINFIKPRWNGSKWEEGAIEEEIKAWQENKTTEKNTQNNTLEQRVLDIEEALAEIIGGM